MSSKNISGTHHFTIWQVCEIRNNVGEGGEVLPCEVTNFNAGFIDNELKIFFCEIEYAAVFCEGPCIRQNLIRRKNFCNAPSAWGRERNFQDFASLGGFTVY